MASQMETVDAVLSALAPLGDVAARKMFGEYGIYYDGKMFGMVCDDRFLIKVTEAGMSMLENPVLVPPYPGAKPSILVEDLQMPHLIELCRKTCDALPLPKPRKRKP